MGMQLLYLVELLLPRLQELREGFSGACRLQWEAVPRRRRFRSEEREGAAACSADHLRRRRRGVDCLATRHRQLQGACLRNRRNQHNRVEGSCSEVVQQSQRNQPTVRAAVCSEVVPIRQKHLRGGDCSGRPPQTFPPAACLEHHLELRLLLAVCSARQKIKNQPSRSRRDPLAAFLVRPSQLNPHQPAVSLVRTGPQLIAHQHQPVGYSELQQRPRPTVLLLRPLPPEVCSASGAPSPQMGLLREVCSGV